MEIKQLKDYGFDFAGYKGMIEGNAEQLAMDAALISTPNTAVPVELTTWMDNKVIDILTAKRAATEIFGEVKKGNRATPIAKFAAMEQTGYTQPYADYSDNGVSDINVNYPMRENYLFETIIRYGDVEQEVNALAKINLAAEKQRSAAHTLAVDANKFYLKGVAGLQNYGILNDPSLPASTAATAGAGGSALWANKTNVEIYNDILASFGRLSARAAGLVSETTPLKLVVSPASNVRLGASSQYNQTVKDLLKNYFTNLEIVVLPELTSNAGTNMMLVATNVEGQETGECAFSEKMIAGRVISELSSFKQKFSAGTFGAVIYRPFLIDVTSGI